MKAYGKSWNYNVNDCRHCLYWKGKKTGCIYEDGCCCSIPQKPAKRNGVVQHYPRIAEEPAPASECKDCPYGRDSPCYWKGKVPAFSCVHKETMRSSGLNKECDSHYV